MHLLRLIYNRKNVRFTKGLPTLLFTQKKIIVFSLFLSMFSILEPNSGFQVIATTTSYLAQTPTNSETTKPPETVDSDIAKQLIGTWKGKYLSSNETMFYTFTEDNKLFIINQSQSGRFGVEARYKLINTKNIPMQIDVNFGKNETIQTIFELTNKRKNNYEKLRIELASSNSGNRPNAFSDFSKAKTIALNRISNIPDIKNTSIVEYQEE